MAQYALARHVFVCTQGEHVVFLDVRKDRYFAIECVKTAGLGALVPEWPVPGLIDAVAPLDPREAAVRLAQQRSDHDALAPVISLLIEKEILTAPDDGKPATPVTVPAPVAEITGDLLGEMPRIRTGTLATFVMASLRARLLLKHRAFERVIGRVNERNRATSTRQNEERIQELVASYVALRPFFFTAKNACLFDALSLHEFLSTYEVLTRWVFGVQARPFAAHCWLQLDGVVLNDTVEHVRRYTPIMIV